MGIRVCHIITRMVIGGAQENTLLTLKGLRERGYEPFLITGASPKEEGSLLPELKKEKLPFLVLPSLVRPVSPKKDFQALLALISILRREAFPLVHTHTSKAGFLGRLAALCAGTPVLVHTPHGHVFHSYFPPLKTKLFLELEKWLARWTHAYIALTPSEKEEHLQAGVGKEHQFHVIPSGISLPEEKSFVEEGKHLRSRLFPASSFVAGTVSRLAPIKGIPVLLAAFRKLAHKFPHFFLLLVGNGPERAKYERLVASWGLRARVHFAGFQSCVYPYIAAMDVFVLASLNEAMGKVLLQAASLKKAVIASHIGGIKDLIFPGRTGFLFPPQDENQLARLIELLMISPHLRQELGQNFFHELSEAWTERGMVAKIVSLYESLLK